MYIPNLRFSEPSESQNLQSGLHFRLANCCCIVPAADAEGHLLITGGVSENTSAFWCEMLTTASVDMYLSQRQKKALILLPVLMWWRMLHKKSH